MTAGRRLAAALAILTLAACTTPSDRVGNAVSALDIRTPTTSAASSSSAPAPAGDCTPSRFAPAAPLPAPGRMPAGTFMHTIQQRGHLTVAVDQNTMLFGYFNPITGAIEGFDIDIAKEVARAIFGTDKGHLALRAVVTAQRIPFVQAGTVDLAADAVTITCVRARDVDFSTIYFKARQRVLVRSDSSAVGLSDLRGRKVCVTAGSTAQQVVADPAFGTVPYPVAARTDCLVALQSGLVDGILTDDAILYGFRAQDPYTKLLAPSYRDEPYGLAVAKEHPEFVAFVNGVYERMIADGTWQRIYDKWLGDVAGAAEPPRPCYRPTVKCP